MWNYLDPKIPATYQPNEPITVQALSQSPACREQLRHYRGRQREGVKGGERKKDKWEQERGLPPVISSLQSVLGVRVSISNAHPMITLDNWKVGNQWPAWVRFRTRRPCWGVVGGAHVGFYVDKKNQMTALSELIPFLYKLSMCHWLLCQPGVKLFNSRLRWKLSDCRSQWLLHQTKWWFKKQTHSASKQGRALWRGRI